MTKKSHNKKRNVGIIYEQLLSLAAKGLVENDNTNVRKVQNIIRRFFKPGTELYKEHRLFKALVEPTINDGSLATKILEQAKMGARMHEIENLEKEKSRLIKEINYTFGKDFYSIPIKDYTDYATVQTLLNDWRSYSKADLARVSLYENKVHNILTRQKETISLKEEKDPQVNKLIVKLMTEKFNNKYGKQLSEVQQNIIKKHVFGQTLELQQLLETIKLKTLKNVDNYYRECDNEIVSKKLLEIKNDINSLNSNNIDDKTIVKFLTICSLNEEIGR